jgi:mannan endo-1,4-beta-mannosidase
MARFSTFWLGRTVLQGSILLLAWLHSVHSSRTVDYLNSISGSFTVAGIHNRNSPNPAEFTEKAKEVSGRYPALWSGDFLFDTANIDARWTMINEAQAQWDSGSLINLMWHACNPALSEPCEWDEGSGPRSNLTDSQWEELVTEGTALNSRWKEMMDDVAQYLLFLQDKGVKVMFRPLHEMNQGVFWWAGQPGSERTVKLYQLTHDYFVHDKGLSSLIWVWNIQDLNVSDKDGLINVARSYNPGSDYWDIATLDVYEGFESWKYEAMVDVSDGKLIGIGECSKLPDVTTLENEPLWTFFMSWSELTFNSTINSDQSIIDLYNSNRVVTHDELPFSGNALVLLQSAHGTYLSGWDDGVVKMQQSAQDWERWTKVPMESGKIAFRSFHGTFLSAWDDGSVTLAPHAQGWEEWTEVSNEDGSVALLSHHGTYLSAWPDESVRQASQNQGWEQWHY